VGSPDQLAVPITVRAEYKALGSGILGQAGPGAIWRDFPNAPRANTWFTQAVAFKKAGKRLGGTAPDIIAIFSSSFPNWHFGSAPAPLAKYDFTTVVAHELGHGLGFFGLGRVSGSQGFMRLDGRLSAYDWYTEKGNNVALRGLREGSTDLGSALRSNTVVFDSTQVRNQNGGRPAKLFAPAGFILGAAIRTWMRTRFQKETRIR
jgi:hypothetical protein